MPEVKGEAPIRAFVEHALASTPVGALGVDPCRFQVAGQFNQPWVVRWLVLDFDEHVRASLPAFSAGLESVGVYVYASAGTTGRGAHVYVFVERDVIQREAHDFAERLAAVAVRYGMPLPQLFPNNSFRRSEAILLPYRGAAHDGFGSNPLLDPGSLEPLPVSDLVRVRLTSVAALEALHRPAPTSLGWQAERSVDALARTPLQPSLDENAWRAERDRVRGYWRPGHRQHLTLGTAAFGLACGVTPDEVETDLLCLAAECGDDELDARRDAIRNTVSRSSAGRAVAIRHFYELAEVPAPRSLASNDYTQVPLDAFEHYIGSRQWVGKSELSDKAVLLAIIEVARKHGQQKDGDVLVRASVRALAELAGLYYGTVLAAIKRLHTAGLVERIQQEHGPSAGLLRLRCAQFNQSTYSVTSSITEEEQGSTNGWFSRTFRWGKGMLTPLDREVLTALREAICPLRRVDLAQKLGRTPSSLSRSLERLRRHQLTYQDEQHAYTVVTDLVAALELATVRSGAAAAASRQRAQHEDDRERYRELHAVMLMRRAGMLLEQDDTQVTGANQMPVRAILTKEMVCPGLVSDRERTRASTPRSGSARRMRKLSTATTP